MKAIEMIEQSELSRVIEAQKQGNALGICSVCSAHPFVIESTFRHALAADTHALIESTCNQVNQFGGYTGMTPYDFKEYIQQLAAQCHFPVRRIILGGDHLGPSPWQDEPAASAMEKARTLVRDCVRAGYVKIHLDASMKCSDDDPSRPLEKIRSAERAAELAQVAEQASLDSGNPISPHYVIGTEVPLPGGTQEQEDNICVTPPTDVAETIEVTRQSFLDKDLADAWSRVIAVVVQPGVEYGDSNLFEYDRLAAADLSHFIENDSQLVYEAHSTDYQTAKALKALVEDHFAILKVGPALTYAFREAVFALASIEYEWLVGRPNIDLSRVREALDQAMLANPVYWQKYYGGSDRERQFARIYSFSDRSRYYWPVNTVQIALEKLLQNLTTEPIPYSLLSQFIPKQYDRIRQGLVDNDPNALILDNITSVLDDYAYACGR